MNIYYMNEIIIFMYDLMVEMLEQLVTPLIQTLFTILVEQIVLKMFSSLGMMCIRLSCTKQAISRQKLS